MPTYLRGLLMGLAYVAPIGTQNLFVIQSAMHETRKRSLLTALIVIFFDVSLSLACFFGIGALMERFPLLQQIILLVGSLIVLWIGFSLVRSQETSLSTEARTSASWLKTAGQICVVTWFNPQAILDGTMLLGASRATLAAGQTLPFVLGFTSASWIWFLGLTLVLSFLHGKLSDKVLLWINRVCGAVILFYGARLLWRFIQGIL